MSQKPHKKKRYKPRKEYAAFIKRLNMSGEVVDIDRLRKQVIVRLPEFKYETCEYDFDFEEIILLEKTTDAAGKIIFIESDDIN